MLYYVAIQACQTQKSAAVTWTKNIFPIIPAEVEEAAERATAVARASTPPPQNKEVIAIWFSTLPLSLYYKAATGNVTSCATHVTLGLQASKSFLWGEV